MVAMTKTLCRPVFRAASSRQASSGAFLAAACQRQHKRQLHSQHRAQLPSASALGTPGSCNAAAAVAAGLALVVATVGGVSRSLNCTEEKACGCGTKVTKADEACMETAAASARLGIRLEHGGPFGASVVRDGVIIAASHNMVLRNGDPTCHAEMSAIRQACKALGTHDLSDCHLYTTCEPCPMCWGAVQWSRLGRAYIGVDRETAAKYGFDDKVFYEEVDEKAGIYGLRREGYMYGSSDVHVPESKRTGNNMVEIYDGILREECSALFTNPAVNRTFKRRYAPAGTNTLHQAAQDAFPHSAAQRAPPTGPEHKHMEFHEACMRVAIKAAEDGAKEGESKEREPFGAVVVRNGTVIARACNTVHSSRDATATAEINAIRAASATLGTHNLDGCDLYTIVQPDVMSLGAILWSRISHVYCGLPQQFAAQYGFEEGSLHFKDLLETEISKRGTEVVEGVSVAECEAVFKEWSELNGVIY